MSIAFDAATTSGIATNSSRTYAYRSTAAIACNSVTYNGVNMAKARSDTKVVGTKNLEVSLWILYAPASGANNVVVTISATAYLGAVASSYTGVYQSNTPDAVNGLTGDATGSQSFDVTTVEDNCWVVAAGAINISSNTSAGNQTVRGSHVYGNSFSIFLEDTNGPKTPAGAQSMGFTVSGYTGQYWAFSGVSLAPAAAATGNPHYAYAQQ
jgi:hypothetical protein